MNYINEIPSLRDEIVRKTCKLTINGPFAFLMNIFEPVIIIVILASSMFPFVAANSSCFVREEIESLVALLLKHIIECSMHSNHQESKTINLPVYDNYNPLCRSFSTNVSVSGGRMKKAYQWYGIM